MSVHHVLNDICNVSSTQYIFYIHIMSTHVMSIQYIQYYDYTFFVYIVYTYYGYTIFAYLQTFVYIFGVCRLHIPPYARVCR